MRREKVRFWVWGNDEPVLITLKAGQTLHYASGGDGDEGPMWHGYQWEFDGEVIEETEARWGRDCDGRFEESRQCICPVQLAKGGEQSPTHPGVFWPKWLEVGSGQRDYSAEAMGY
jgi:hypothetical protein